MATLQTVLNGIAAYVNQDPTLPTGTDLTSWTNLVDQSQKEWSEVYQWKQLVTSVNLSFSVSGASIGIPSNFEKTMSPVFDYSTTTPTAYREILRQDRFNKGVTDKYFYTAGDDAQGRYIMINPVPASGASLVVDIQITPSSLATTTDVVTCPSTQFLVLRTIAKILSARSDPRFPSVKGESDDVLSSLIEEEMAPSLGRLNRTPDQFTKLGFKVGA